MPLVDGAGKALVESAAPAFGSNDEPFGAGLCCIAGEPVAGEAIKVGVAVTCRPAGEATAAAAAEDLAFAFGLFSLLGLPLTACCGEVCDEGNWLWLLVERIPRPDSTLDDDANWWGAEDGTPAPLRSPIP